MTAPRIEISRFIITTPAPAPVPHIEIAEFALTVTPPNDEAES